MLPELYHAHHNRHLEDIPFWLDLAAEQGSPILELGCGTGRVLIPLARAGFSSLGLDHDLAMLIYLRSNLRSLINPQPLIMLADISSFNLSRKFHLVILPCNTFSTLSAMSRKACLQCVRRHLEPGGLFAVSVPNPAMLMELPAHSQVELEEEFTHPLSGNPLQVSSTWRRTKTTFTLRWFYDHLLPDGSVERMQVEIIHQLVSMEGYLDEIKVAGMEIRAIYGDFDRSVYRADSAYLILLAEVQY
jgi:SAM-dependent methyltransferase